MKSKNPFDKMSKSKMREEAQDSMPKMKGEMKAPKKMPRKTFNQRKGK